VHILHSQRSTDKGIHIAQGTGNGGWNAAYAKAKALVAQMTLEEKVGSYPSLLFELRLRISRAI
jgi:hypothetical protein